MRLYEQAIRSARDNGFVHNEAFAYERAGASTVRAVSNRSLISICATPATATCAGAPTARCGSSRRSIRSSGRKSRAPGPTSTIATPVERLDLATVIKVSQAVSGEIVLEKLIDTLMRTAIEQAGAERGLLILSRGDDPRIAAEADDQQRRGHRATSRRARDRLGSAGVGPSLRPAHPARASFWTTPRQSSFAADPYIRQRQARSILCLPLINQAKLIGVLYLENNLTPRAFAPARIAVLKLLASQAATSLENTRLYRDLERTRSQDPASGRRQHHRHFHLGS